MYPCMEALRRQTYTDFEVLIVDNGSSDGSPELIREMEGSFPFPVKGIFLSENTGFSGAVNAGIGAASGEYVVLLNNDTEAEPGYLEALCRELDADREGRVFAVTPKMIQLYHKDLLDDAGDGVVRIVMAFCFPRCVPERRGAPEDAISFQTEKRTKTESPS